MLDIKAKSIKSSLIEVEAAVDADAQCSTSCPVSPGSTTTAKCGGPGGLVSVYTSFKAFSTLNVGTANSTRRLFSSRYSGVVVDFSARTRNSFKGSPSTVQLEKKFKLNYI